MNARLPWITVAIASLCLLSTYVPAIGERLIFDRRAIVDGQLWRIATGHLHHFSSLHLGCNLLPFVLMGAILERRSPVSMIHLGITLAVLIGISLFAMRPAMQRYGGLSGMVCGMVAASAVHDARFAGLRGWYCRLVIVLLVIKIGIELHGVTISVIDTPSLGICVMPLSHATGFLAAVCFVIIQWAVGHGGVPSASQTRETARISTIRQSRTRSC